MINREDMLELTRRMTPSRSSFTRIAGCYVDEEGFIDGTFNTNFLKLSAREKEKNLAIAKTIPFSNTNENLKEYKIADHGNGTVSMLQLLQGMKACGLKNDALMDTFYELITERYQHNEDYCIYVFHDRYDVPVKAMDKERLGESEEVFEYLICAICPLTGEYEPGSPECGFLYPMFEDRSCDLDHIGIFHKDPSKLHKEFVDLLLSN